VGGLVLEIGTDSNCDESDGFADDKVDEASASEDDDDDDSDSSGSDADGEDEEEDDGTSELTVRSAGEGSIQRHESSI
jgi:hypothetical protein